MGKTKNRPLNLNFVNLHLLRLYLSLVVSIIMVSCHEDNSVPAVEEEVGEPVLTVAPNIKFTALNDANTLVYYNAQNLDTPLQLVPIQGLADSENIISIDYRPATGQLYGLGSLGRLYFINENNGFATVVGTQPVPTPHYNASIDFDAASDRILYSTDNVDYSLHPENATFNGVAYSSYGDNTKIGATAFRSSVSGVSATISYSIDFGGDNLLARSQQGVLSLVGKLNVDFEGLGDFDITPDNAVSLAVVRNNAVSKLYTINLNSGKAEWVGTFSLPIVSLAFKTNPVAFAVTLDKKLHRFNPLNPSPNPVDLELPSNQTIVALDFRPATGTLYALTNSGSIYTVNTANGELTTISGNYINILGTSFGFDFNPKDDTGRMVSNVGENHMLTSFFPIITTPQVVLNPGSPFVNGAAYTNNYDKATSTSLYVLDSQAGMLYIQNPASLGVLSPVGYLGQSIEAENGFDIGGHSGSAYALLKVNNVTGMYSINLSTGEATKIADFNINATALAIGLGF